MCSEFFAIPYLIGLAHSLPPNFKIVWEQNFSEEDPDQKSTILLLSPCRPCDMMLNKKSLGIDFYLICFFINNKAGPVHLKGLAVDHMLEHFY